MWLYTKYQYKSAIENKDKEIEDILDTFRDEIINYLESIAKSEDYKEKYELLLRNKGCYENLMNDLQIGQDRDEIFKKYDLCFQYHECWYLLDKIVYEDNRLLCYVNDYASFPPDYGCLSLDETPSKVLYKALRIFKKEKSDDLQISDGELCSINTLIPESLSYNEGMHFPTKEEIIFRDTNRTNPIVLEMFNNNWDVKRIYENLQNIYADYCWDDKFENLIIIFNEDKKNCPTSILAQRIAAALTAFGQKILKYEDTRESFYAMVMLSCSMHPTEWNDTLCYEKDFKIALNYCDLFSKNMDGNYTNGNLISEKQLVTDFDYPIITDEELDFLFAKFSYLH